MKTNFCMYLLATILLPTILVSQGNESQLNTSMITSTVEHASTNFSNRDMYINSERWIGTTIRVEGTFVNRLKAVLHTDRPYEEFYGRNMTGRVVDLIIYYDPRNASNRWRTNDTLLSAITDENNVWIVGSIRRSVEVVTVEGVLKRLPVMELLLVFRNDDVNNSKPLYMTPLFKN